MAMGQELELRFGNQIVTLKLGKELGRGAFGTVSLAVNPITNKSYAVKRSQCIDADTCHAAAAEIEALITLDHPNIAKMNAFDFLENSAVIVMEYCEGGDLNQRLSRKVDDGKKLEWINQIFDAIIYLHSKGIVHRDLKPENVLISNDALKLTDFGISCFYKRNTMGENNLSEFLGTFAGTPYWVAPEVFDHRYTETADVFSVGVLCYAILLQESMQHEGKNYFGIFVQENNQRKVGLGLAMFQENREIQPPTRYEGSLEINDMVCGLVKRDPLQRLPLEDSKKIVMKVLDSKKEQNMSWMQWFNLKSRSYTGGYCNLL